MTRRTRRIVASALAGLSALAVAAPVQAHTGDLPDLVADPVTRPYFQLDASASQRARLLLRFDGHVHNAGTGALEVRREVDGLVAQIIRGGATPSLNPLDTGDLKYENTDGHNHWHLQRIAEYALVDAAGAHVVAPAMKVGFCLMDSERISGSVTQVYHGFGSCGTGRPRPASPITMGVSSGWRDLYTGDLPFQWVDASEVQPGTYRLRSRIDPYDLIDESDETNVPQDVRGQEIPGYVAQAVDAPGPGTVTLGADRFGPVDPPRFKVVTPPAHGSLDVATGAWFTAADVTYTGAGADRFVYLAADPASSFPRHPARATALVGGTGERVALSGVPEAMAAGVTVDLDARLVGAAGAVTWSATGGASVDADGRLTAPAGPAVVSVTARGPGGATDTMSIRVLAPDPDPEPAPNPPVDPPAGAVIPTAIAPPPAAAVPTTAAQPAPRRTPIGSVRVRRIGGQLTVAVTPRSSGRLRATLLRGSRRLSTCALRVRAGRSALCRLKVRPRATAVAVTLVRPSGTTERRRLTVPR